MSDLRVFGLEPDTLLFYRYFFNFPFTKMIFNDIIKMLSYIVNNNIRYEEVVTLW